MHDALALKMTRVAGLLWGSVHPELVAVRPLIPNRQRKRAWKIPLMHR
jgi:hypothetical protein